MTACSREEKRKNRTSSKSVYGQLSPSRREKEIIDKNNAENQAASNHASNVGTSFHGALRTVNVQHGQWKSACEHHKNWGWGYWWVVRLQLSTMRCAPHQVLAAGFAALGLHRLPGDIHRLWEDSHRPIASVLDSNIRDGGCTSRKRSHNRKDRDDRERERLLPD